MGTPQAIVSNPSDAYVNEFVRGISKTKVLGAASIMQELDGLDPSQLQSCPRVSPDTRIDDLVPLAAESGSPIAVVGDDGALLGVVTTTALLNSIAESQRSQTEEAPYFPGIEDNDGRWPYARLRGEKIISNAHAKCSPAGSEGQLRWISHVIWML